ncbi:hypothetical protein DFJ74DRAFT_310726 [Hyaloraphidium curvatum]|nr:hypothetical protein DFJ74DRAFT_310726 [Hyaloraphidium curvatum]
MPPRRAVTKQTANPGSTAAMCSSLKHPSAEEAEEAEEGADVRPAPNLHLLPPEILDAVLRRLPPWDLLSAARTHSLLAEPALRCLWCEMHVFGGPPRASFAGGGFADYTSFVRSVVSGWFALDSPALDAVLSRVGANLAKLDLWRLRIRAEHAAKGSDVALASHLSDRLTTLDISDVSTGLKRELIERPGLLLQAAAARCTNLRRLYVHETCLDPAVLLGVLEGLPRLEELWMGHGSWAAKKPGRFIAVQQAQIDGMAKAVSGSLKELGLFQMTMDGRACRVLRPFLERCPQLHSLVFKRNDARHIFGDMIEAAGRPGSAAGRAVAETTSLRVKIAAATELEPFLALLPSLTSLTFLHLTLYFDFRDPKAELNGLTRLTAALEALRLPALETLRLSLEISYSTSLEAGERDGLFASLLTRLDVSFPSLSHLDFKAAFMDSHSKQVAWGPLTSSALASVAAAKVDRGSPLRRLSASAWHLASRSDLAAMLAPFSGRLSSLVLRDAPPSLIVELKSTFGNDAWEEACAAGAPLGVREAMPWRRWAGQAEFWSSTGWGMFDNAGGEGGEDGEEETYETHYAWFGSAGAIAFAAWADGQAGAAE